MLTALLSTAVGLAANTAAVLGATMTFTVTNTNDTGVGSLRAAILAANANPGADTINFNIAGAGVHTIAPLTALPDITSPVTIDGYSQPGASANTLAVGSDAVLLIALSGASAPTGTDGLRASTDDSVVRGLVIDAWKASLVSNVPDSGGHGVVILAGADRNSVQDNFIGTNATGNTAVANYVGVGILAGSDNTIGGTAPAARNVVSGNSRFGIWLDGPDTHQTVLQGNYIGTNAAGSSGVPNEVGVFIVDGPKDSLVGGLTSGARNVISGNVQFGVNVTKTATSIADDPIKNPTGTIVRGNWIGINATGDGVLGNGTGVAISSADGVVVGGSPAGAGNVISRQR